MLIPITLGYDSDNKITKDLVDLNHLLVCVDSKQLDDIYASTLESKNDYGNFDLYTIPFVLKDERKQSIAYTMVECIHKQINERYDLLSANDCRNISEYNNTHTKKLNHIVYLAVGYPDSTYLEYKKIDKYLSEVLMLGRAVGIHLICIIDDTSNMSDAVYLNFANKICASTCGDKEICDYFDNIKLEDDELIFDCINDDEVKILKYSLDKLLKENKWNTK